MRVIIVSKSVDHKDGLGAMTYNSCFYLFKRRINFDLLVSVDAERLETPFTNQTHFILPKLPLSFSGLGLKSIFKLLRPIPFFIDKREAVIVHSIADFPSAVLGWKIAKKLQRPFIFTAHGTYSVRPFTCYPDRWLFKPVYRGAKTIVAISNFTARKMQEIGGLRENVIVIENPARDIFLSEEDVLKSLGQHLLSHLPLKSRVILSVGPHKPRKGLDVLIRALPLVVEKVPNAHLVIVGGGDPEHNLSFLPDGLRGNVHLLKDLPPDELASLFASCDLFVLTPRYCDHAFEGYGLVYLEAGLYKKPVVGSLSGGVPETVQHGKTGLLVPENDPTATAAAIVKILKDGELAEQLGWNNYCLARERNWENYTTKLIKVYENTLRS